MYLAALRLHCYLRPCLGLCHQVRGSYAFKEQYALLEVGYARNSIDAAAKEKTNHSMVEVCHLLAYHSLELRSILKQACLPCTC